MRESAEARSNLRRFVGVPNTWDGWATRVLTVAVVVNMALAIWLAGKVATVDDQITETNTLTVNQNDFMTQSRQQRTAFQGEETARQCETLRRLNTPSDVLRALRC